MLPFVYDLRLRRENSVRSACAGLNGNFSQDLEEACLLVGYIRPHITSNYEPLTTGIEWPILPLLPLLLLAISQRCENRGNHVES